MAMLAYSSEKFFRSGEKSGHREVASACESGRSWRGEATTIPIDREASCAGRRKTATCRWTDDDRENQGPRLS